MDKYSKGILVALIVTLVLIVTISKFRLKREIGKLEIYGVIEEIEVREKAISYYKINGEWISFSYLADSFDKFLLRNDSLVKNKTELKMKVFRKVNNRYKEIRTIEFH